MLAEAFDEEVRIFYQSAESVSLLEFKLELFELYGQFIERKYDIFQEDKFIVRAGNVVAIEQRERDLKNMRKDHQLLALKVLFTEEQVVLIESKSDCTFSIEQLTRIGIVQVSDEGKPHFIHHTFAEYYVADCLVNRLTEGNNTSEQLLSFILKDIFQKEQHQVVRAFIDGLLSRSKISKEMLKQYGNQTHDLRKYDDKILHRAAFEGNANIIGFLLDSVQEEDHTDTVNKLLLEEDEEGLTAWNIAILFNNTQVLEKVWECAEKKLTAEELKNELLLAGVSVTFKSPGREAWWGRQKTLWSWRQEILVIRIGIQCRNWPYEAGTVWQVAALLGNVDILQKLWEWAKEKLTTEEINNKFLLGTDNEGRTVWHVAAQRGNLEMLQKVWDWNKEKLTTEEINNKLLLGTDNERKTAWHLAAECGKSEILQKVWEWAKEKLTREEINNKLLLATDNEARTAWHLAAKMGNLESLQKVWERAEEELTTEELKKNCY
jgi:ankyrin repeat protein